MTSSIFNRFSHFVMPDFKFVCEKWKWNDKYQIYVSNLGNFKNENKCKLDFRTTSNGYLRVETALGYRLAHRVVAETWLPCENVNNMTVDHLNHNKRDNSVVNLEWVSCKENLRRANKDFLSDTQIMKSEIIFSEHEKEKAIIATNKSTGKRMVFSSLDAAANWFFESQGASSIRSTSSVEAVLDNIKNRILVKISNGNIYGGYSWGICKE